MPTSITKFITFDGQEFPTEDEAKKYEDFVRKCGASLRKNFLEICEEEGPGYIDKGLLECMKSYLEKDAWLIMKNLYLAHDVIEKVQISRGEFEVEEYFWLKNSPESY